MDQYHRGRFSLVALFRSPERDDVAFAQCIRPVVLGHAFKPGFTELII